MSEQPQPATEGMQWTLTPAPTLPPAPDGMQWTLTPLPVMHSCAGCAEPLKPVFEDTAGQYEDALAVILAGGYGMFFDAGDHTVFLCHSCAHAACEALPWLKQVMGPLHGSCDRIAEWNENNDGTSCIGYIPGGDDNA